ncbi:MAG: membrane-bound lytic murein transglycosylase MltF [Gammaproteobacteria bacterium]|nr:membrane-bound lytic murein transglycosylase MltF [Gammaproteobacteria bacterium]MBM4216673.1 membrane-bound lytic murein transglycosylase MltF [Gammaproteobacteria bacterium]
MTRTWTVRRGLRTLPALMVLLMLAGCGHGVALEEIRERGELRVATLNGPTTYYIGPVGPEGSEHALAERFATELGVKLTLVVESDRAGLQRALKDKRADIVAAQLSSDSKWRQVALLSTIYSESPLFWIYSKDRPRPKTLKDIAALRVVVADESAELAVLEKQPAVGRPRIRYTVVPRHVGRDPLELVSSGRADVTLMDGRKFAAERPLHPSLEVAFALPKQRELHWMVRQDGRDLLELADTFLARERAKTPLPTLEIAVLSKLSVLPRANSDQLLVDIEVRLPVLREIFNEAAELSGLDWRLIAALAYQESMWQADVVSPFGAQGLMMLMPRTAKSLGVVNPFDERENTLAGARYLAELYATIPSRVREPDRLWMAVASYNMGYGHLEDARVMTVKQGGDHDSWIDVRERLTLLSEEFWYLQTKNGYARGFETKQLVDRVQQYLTLIREKFPQEDPQVDTPTRIVAERQEPPR